MIVGWVMALAVFNGNDWVLEKTIDNRLYSSYEICEEYSKTIITAPDEKIVCGEVER